MAKRIACISTFAWARARTPGGAFLRKVDEPVATAGAIVLSRFDGHHVVMADPEGNGSASLPDKREKR